MPVQMRDILLARVRPVLDQLAEQLADMLLERIDLHMNQLELAFDAATSAFASDLSVTDGAARRYDVRDDTHGKRRAAQPRSRAVSGDRKRSSASASLGARVEEHHDAAASDSSSEGAADTRVSSNRALQQGQDLPPSTSSTSAASAVEDSPRPTQRSQGAATPGQSASSAAGNVAEPHRAPSRDRGADAVVVTSSSERRPKTCSICGAIGVTKQGCGKTHNVSTSPASDLPALTRSSPAASPISIPSPPPNQLPDRRSAIAQIASQRSRGALPSVRTSFQIVRGVTTNRVRTRTRASDRLISTTTEQAE